MHGTHNSALMNLYISLVFALESIQMWTELYKRTMTGVEHSQKHDLVVKCKTVENDDGRKGDRGSELVGMELMPLQMIKENKERKN